MLKIDYILLARHFRGETSEDENLTIALWQNENIINGLTYKRLHGVSQKEESPENKNISKEEFKVWKKIITKILEEV
ncbi:MAG: hypothetical protein V4585_17520 [Bacteroidota bacterium]